jgi:hypothetical protein
MRQSRDFRSFIRPIVLGGALQRSKGSRKGSYWSLTIFLFPSVVDKYNESLKSLLVACREERKFQFDFKGKRNKKIHAVMKKRRGMGHLTGDIPKRVQIVFRHFSTTNRNNMHTSLPAVDGIRVLRCLRGTKFLSNISRTSFEGGIDFQGTNHFRK